MEKDEKKEVLIRLRKRTGLSRREFAAKYNIPYPTITDWELGHRRIPEYLLRLLIYSIETQKIEKEPVRTEKAELTVLCLVHRGDELLLQNRVKEEWKGYTLPGGHIEPGESIVDAVKREMKEETGLTIEQPRLRGVKQFPIEDGRYIVFLFETDRFEGEVSDSEEGKMHWVNRQELAKVNLVEDFFDLLDVIENDDLTEFQYLDDGENWNVVKK